MESIFQGWHNIRMVDLTEIAVFVSVAQLGSFTKAARALAMPVSTVSRRIADLEVSALASRHSRLSALHPAAEISRVGRPRSADGR